MKRKERKAHTRNNRRRAGPPAGGFGLLIRTPPPTHFSLSISLTNKKKINAMKKGVVIQLLI